jgi:hypothetical protein
MNNSFGVWLPSLEEYWWSIQKGTATVSTIVGDGDDVTVTTSAAHGLSVGDVVRITGTTNYNVSNAVVHTVGSTTTFEYDSTVSDPQEATGTVDWFAQIVYQANRDLFVGPYSHTIEGGTNFVSAAGAQAYMVTGVSIAGVPEKKDGIPASSPLVPQEFRFWMGQANLAMVKEQVSLEVIYASITADKTITVTGYQNKTATTTDAQSQAATHTATDNLVGRLIYQSGGRMFMAKLELPRDCTAPILAVNYKAAIVPWSEKNYR